MKRPRVIWLILICSLVVNTWLGYREYSRESQNRQALAYPAEMVAYRLTQLTRFADGVSDTEWADTTTRSWIDNSLQAVVDNGAAAERIATRGESANVARKLGELARRVGPYRDAVRGTNPPQDRARIQELAGRIKAAGWAPPEGAGKPAGWTYGRDWAELSRALDQLLPQL